MCLSVTNSTKRDGQRERERERERENEIDIKKINRETEEDIKNGET